jgi:hypothetical protein
MGVAFAATSSNASPSTGVIIGLILIILGSAFALDVKKISTSLLENAAGFAP